MTIRQHLEAIRGACTPDEPDAYEPPRAVICKEHAVAALDKLDSYVLDQSTSIDFRLVPDPVAAATPPDDEGYVAYSNPDSQIDLDALTFKGRKRKAATPPGCTCPGERDQCYCTYGHDPSPPSGT